MSWLKRYRLHHFFRTSFWPLPVGAMFLALLAVPLSRWVDARLGWMFLDVAPAGAQAVLGTFVGSMLTFIVVVTSSLLLVVQLASANLTPRVITALYGQPLVRWSLAVFLFSYAFSLGVLARVDENVPQVPYILAIATNLLCVIMFLYFVSTVGRSLRPIAILTSIASRGGRVVAQVYPLAYDASRPELAVRTSELVKQADRTVVQSAHAGVLLAFDEQGLVEAARRSRCVVELVPCVGDFIAVGDVLFHVYGDRAGGGGVAGGGAIAEQFLRSSVAIGPERTMEQDPVFAFRMIVDIAIKALSPAINDPTTAVLALDQLHRLLRWIGMRTLGDGVVRDSSGDVRLIYRAPHWEDYVCLAVLEIRLLGAGSVSTMRRLRAMLESLQQTLPQARRPAIERELAALHRTIQSSFADPEDRQRAAVGDAQGVGSAPNESPSQGQPG